MLIRRQVIIISFFFLTITNACSSSRSHTTDIIVFDSTKTDLDSFRESFWNNLPKYSGYVNDYENLYTDEEEKYLDSVITMFEKTTTIEIVLVTFDSALIERDKFDALTLHIARHWGVGKKETNNGILIGISKGHRRIRIQNGYGIERILNDSETKSLIDNYFIPEFKAGNYYQGTINGIIELIRILSGRAKF